MVKCDGSKGSILRESASRAMLEMLELSQDGMKIGDSGSGDKGADRCEECEEARC